MSEKKKKINYKERIGKGPFGVGEADQLADTNIYEFATQMDEFEKLTEDLTPEQLEHVHKETRAFAGKYQNLLDGVQKLFSTREGQEAFKKAVMKRTGRK